MKSKASILIIIIFSLIFNLVSSSSFGYSDNTRPNLRASSEDASIFVAYLQADTNKTINSSINKFINVTFDDEIDTLNKNINHIYNDSTNATFTILRSGIYQISYTVSLHDSDAVTNSNNAFRVVDNGVELHGSLVEQDISGTPSSNVDQMVSHSFLAALSANDKLNLQFASDKSTASIASHYTFGSHKDSAILNIHLISS